MADRPRETSPEAHGDPAAVPDDTLQLQIDELRDVVKVCVHFLEGSSAAIAAHPEMRRIKALLGA